MSYRYAVLGSGMQGTAAAYDLAKFAQPARLLMGDVSLEQATRAAHRVSVLSGTVHADPVAVNALDPESLSAFLADVDVLLSCVPYYMHPAIARACVDAGVSMVDLGGNTEVTLETLTLHQAAVEAGVSLVPDCGLAPGLVNSLGLALMERMDQPERVSLYCGVLPQHPVPPLNYKLTFNVEGLVTEYDYEAVILRDGDLGFVDTLSELESITIDGLGEMEAFTTSGGTSTAPYTFQGRLRDYEYKTLRYPGHCAIIRLFRDFGFWNPEPIDVKGTPVIPRELFYKVFGDALTQFVDEDLCAVVAQASGTHQGQPVTYRLDILDRQDPTTGFTAMERLTGFSMSIVAQAVAAGRVARGAVRYEQAMSGGEFVEEIRRRGIDVRES